MKILRTASPAILVFFLLLSCMAAQPGSPAVPAQNSGKELEALLTAMDNAALKFKSAEAEVNVDVYNRAADDTEKQTGKVYFRKKGSQTDMAANFTSPQGEVVRQIVYVEGCVNIFEKKIDQITRYCADKNKEAVDSFLNIGFGGSGHGLQKSFDVSYGGTETIDNKKAEKLVLIPSQTKVKNMFSKITLWIWIDPSTQIALSVKQEFIQPSGDSRTSYYKNIHSPAKIPENVFKVPKAQTCIDGSTGSKCHT